MLRMALLLAPVLTVACTVGPVHFQRSYDVSQTFENYKVLPDHQYYYYGETYSPEAVVAIQKGYTLNSPHWKALEMDERKLRDMLFEMTSFPGAEYKLVNNGAYIFNDNGETIGFWYSIWKLPVLTFVSDTEFTISKVMPVLPYPPGDSDDATFP